MSQIKNQQLAELGDALNTPVSERTKQQCHLIMDASPADFRRASNLLNASTAPGGDGDTDDEPQPIAAQSTFDAAAARDRHRAGHLSDDELAVAITGSDNTQDELETIEGIDQTKAFSIDRKRAGHL